MAAVDSYLTYQVTKFWQWWAKAGDRSHAQIGGRLGQLDRKLLYEITGGTQARYRLTLRPLGDPDRRQIVRVLLAAAPPADATWEFAAGRDPNPTLETIDLGSVDGELLEIDKFDLEDLRELEDVGIKVERVSLADMRVQATWDPDVERADILFWHPAFARLGPDDAYEIARPQVDSLLGDEAGVRWLGELRVDPKGFDGFPVTELPAWIDRQAATATGDRWITERRRDERNRHVAVRFNAAQKSMDLPPKSAGLSVVLQRKVSDVEAPETPESLAPLADLIKNLDPATVRFIEVSESTRLTVYFMSADPKADKRATRAWEKRFPNADAVLEVQRRPKWAAQLRLDDRDRTRGGAVDWQAAPAIKTRGDSWLYRRARWIEHNPRRLLAGPLLTGVGAIILAWTVPAAEHEAALLLIGLAGVTGLLIATYMASSTYVSLRNNAVLGCIALLIDGWRILVLLVISLSLIVVYVGELLSR